MSVHNENASAIRPRCWLERLRWQLLRVCPFGHCSDETLQYRDSPRNTRREVLLILSLVSMTISKPRYPNAQRASLDLVTPMVLVFQRMLAENLEHRAPDVALGKTDTFVVVADGGRVERLYVGNACFEQPRVALGFSSCESTNLPRWWIGLAATRWHSSILASVNAAPRPRFRQVGSLASGAWAFDPTASGNDRGLAKPPLSGGTPSYASESKSVALPIALGPNSPNTPARPTATAPLHRQTRGKRWSARPARAASSSGVPPGGRSIQIPR